MDYLTHYRTMPSVCDMKNLGVDRDEEPSSEYPYVEVRDDGKPPAFWEEGMDPYVQTAWEI